MNAGPCKSALAGLLLIAAAGCQYSSTPITLDTSGIEPALDYEDLAFVLDKVVTKNGLLIPEALENHSDRLDAQLKRLAVTGPGITPKLLVTADEQLAYWYNARAGWAMKLTLLRKFPKKLRRDELIERNFPLDGRMLTLENIDRILETDDDWRVPVAAPGVTLRRCKLPEKPFTAKDVRQRITERFNAFMDDDRRVVIDTRHKRVIFPPVLWRYRQKLIDDYHRNYRTQGANLNTALLRHLTGSAHRRIQDAIGYRCVSSRSTLLVALFKER